MTNWKKICIIKTKKLVVSVLIIGIMSLAIYHASAVASNLQFSQIGQVQSTTSLAANTTIPSENIEMLAHLGGSAVSIAVDGDYAFVGMGPRLVIYDVGTNAPTWTKVGTSEVLPDTIRGISVAGNYAYLAADSTLQILDVSIPAQPVVVGSIDTLTAYDVLVEGDYAYVADSYGLHIFDTSDTAAPQQIGAVNLGSTYALGKSGNIIYVTGYSYLHSIDVSDPTLPTHLYALSTGGLSRSLDIQGEYAYVTSGFSGLRVVDISQPSNLSIVSTVMDGAGPLNVAVHGNYASVLIYPSGLYIVDISNPNAPTEVGNVTAVLGSSEGIALENNYAYIANGWGGLHIADVSDPANPSFVGIDSNTSGTFGQLAAASNHVHALGGNNNFASRSRAIDISDPLNPATDGSIDLLYDEMRAMTGDESYIYLSVSTTSTGPVVQTYSASDLSTVLGTWNSGGHFITALTRDGQYLYAAAAGRMFIIDVSDPANPTEVGATNLSVIAETNGIVVAGQYAYLGRGDDDLDTQSQGVTIIDVSNPVAPVEVNTFTTSGADYADVNGVDVAGDLAYLAAYDAGLRIVDVSDPANPIEIGAYHSVQDVTAVQVVGRYAYLADGSSGLVVLDISDPVNPFQVSAFDVDGARDVLLVGDNIYLSSGENGFFALRQTAVSTTITPGQGETFIYTDTLGLTTTIHLPTDSVNSDTVLLYASVPEVTPTAGLQFAGRAFDLTAYQDGVSQSNFAFLQPVSVSLTYRDEDVDGLDESKLTLQVWDGAAWMDAATTCSPPSSYTRDTDDNTISVDICHLSRFALMEFSGQQLFLPLVVR